MAATSDQGELQELVSKLFQLRHLLTKEAIAHAPDLAKRLRVIRDASQDETRGMAAQLTYACGAIKKRSRALDSEVCSSAMIRAGAQLSTCKDL